MCHEFTYRSADGHTDIHAAEWLPQGQVRAVVQISHGVAEYIMRYAPFAKRLTDAGFAVVGNDHLGHGESVAPGGARLFFGSGNSWNLVVDDLYQRRQLAGKRFPGVPCFLLGHSMGSFLARTYLIRYPGTVDGAIIMGSGYMPQATLKAGRALAIAEGHRRGESSPSPLMEKIAFGGYNKRFSPNRTEQDWLSSSEENVDHYIADPLCGGTPSAGLFREMLGGMSFMERPENLRKMNLNTPILFVSGDQDPVGNMGKGVRQSVASFKKAGVRQVDMKLYPGLRHEILNGVRREEVASDLIDWLEKQL